MKSHERRFWVSLVLVGLICIAGGCAKKPPATVAPEVPPALQPPSELDLSLEATLKETPALSSLAVSPAEGKPGAPISFSARAVVPEGHKLTAEVEGTGLKVPLSAGAAGYGATAAIPDVAPGSYAVRGVITRPDGTKAADLAATSRLNVLPRTQPCVELQNQLAALRPPFDYDNAVLNERAKQITQQAANLLKGKTWDLVIEGHCDARGSNEYNLALSQKRAANARTYLVALGAVEAAKTRLVPKGEEEPRAPGDTEAAYAENRRVEFELVCPGQ